LQVELIGYKKNSEKYYYVKDQTGNISAIIDGKGNFINKYSYDAYGNVIYSLNQNSDSKIRFKGYYYDEEIGLYWIGSRCYNPKWGRFIQPSDASGLNIYDVNGLNLYAYCGNDPVNYEQRPVSSGGSVISSSISAVGSSGGGNIGGANNPSAPWWVSTAVGAIPDFILGMRYLAASGMHSKFAYATNTRYMYPIMGGTWRWFVKSSSSFGTVVQGTFNQILTGDAKAGFGAIAKSFGGVVGLNALVNFGFNLYENNWQVDSAMLKDTAIDTAIGVGSYYLAAGTMSLVAAGVVTAGFAMPGIVVVGGIILLSIGFEHLIRAIFGYWD